MKELGNKPLCLPQPVFMIGTYDKDKNPNLMNAAWGGISYDDEITICLANDHKTTDNLKLKGALTISMGTRKYLKECDYFGLVSGAKEDKVKKANFHAIKAPHVDAPMFTELPLVIEGEVISYDDESCRLVVKIINVLADESILDENGKVDPMKLEPIAYDPFNHKYLVVKEIVGSAFKDGVELLKK